MTRNEAVELVLYGELQGAGIEVECTCWNPVEKRMRAVDVSDVTKQDHIGFTRLVIRPPNAEEIAAACLRKGSQEVTSDNINEDARGKEVQSEILARFVRRLKAVKLARTADAAGAKPKVLTERAEKSQGLNVELGMWTGLSNDVWHSILSMPDLTRVRLFSPDLPLANTLRPVEIGSIATSVGRYTPFFVEPLVMAEADNDERDSVGPNEMPSRQEQGSNEDRGLGKGLQGLELENLSQIGTKNLVNHLNNLSDCVPSASLAHLSVSTLFFDPALCAAIATIGSCGSLKTLKIGTRGTKLSSAGMREMIEECVGLERLELDDVEGRLAKTLWKDVEEYPEGLKEIVITIPETGSHHSWTLDHLTSLSDVPLANLNTLEVTRSVPVAAAMPYLPMTNQSSVSFQIPKVNDLCRSQPVPDEIFQAILDKGENLTKLNLDWWEIDEERLVKLVKTLVGLEELTVRLDFPMFRLVTVTAFPSTSRLERLRVSFVPTVDLCWEMDATKVSGRTTKMAPLNKVAARPDIPDSALEGVPLELAEALRMPDSVIPASKEIKKFARKLPRLERLEWIGREGKGSWTICKSSTEKKGGLITVSYEHAGLHYLEQWKELSAGPIEISSAGEQDVPVSDVPPPATPSTSAFSPGSSDLQMMSPLTNGSTLASDEVDTPLARWHSSRSSSFPCLSGPWADETQDNVTWDALGLQNVSPSPSANILSQSRRPSRGKPAAMVAQLKPGSTVKPSSSPLPKKPSLPRGETGPTNPETPPRRRGRRGGAGRSRPSATLAATEPIVEPVKAPVLASCPDGWMTISTRKNKETVKPIRTAAASSGSDKRAKK